MSQLRSVLDQLAVLDPDQLSIEQVAAEIEEAVIGIQALEVFIATWTKNLGDRRGHELLGYPSPTAYLRHRGRLSDGHAQQVVARANASVRAPGAFRAWADGRISTDQSR